MSDQPVAKADLLSAYLDDALPGPERAEFERMLANDGELRAAHDLQLRIDERLRVVGAAPEFPGVPGQNSGREETAGRIGGRAALPAWLKVAAAAALVALGAWAAVVKPWNSMFSPPPSLAAADGVYNRLVRTGFTPDWVCGSEQEFLAYTQKELGTPFTVTAEPGVQLVGWTYTDSILGENAKVLLVKRAETPVMVVMDELAHDRVVRLEPGSSLRVHRGRVGTVVLYEIGPSETPVVVGHTVAK